MAVAEGKCSESSPKKTYIKMNKLSKKNPAIKQTETLQVSGNQPKANNRITFIHENLVELW